ncbi:MAG: HDIG domain-containing protein [Leptolyngbyaceae bacterium]|nr:HDIG domain-containing protein [Leptolyngbyaceae bacterium]
MNPFRSLTKQLGQWWQSDPADPSVGADPRHNSGRTGRAHPRRSTLTDSWQRISKLRSSVQSELFSSDSKIFSRPDPPRYKVSKYKRSSPIVFLVAVASLTSAIGYRLYNEPKLDVGTISPQTLRAPRAASVEDRKTTEEMREAASKGALPVLTIDSTVNQRVYQSLQRLIDDADALREQAGGFPFVEPSVLSTATQRYLRSIPDEEWLATLNIVEGRANVSPSNQANQNSNSVTSGSSENDVGQSSQQLAVIELQAYRRKVSPDDFSVLQQLIIRARQRYQVAQASLGSSPIAKPDQQLSTEILKLSDADWEATKTGVRRALEGILLQGISPGLPPTLIEQSARYQSDPYVPAAAHQLAVDILTTVIKPNLTVDEEQTRVFAEQAAQAVEIQIVDVRRGEVIVEAGETITQEQFVLLDEFGLSRRGINWFGLSGFAIFIGGCVFVFLLSERWFRLNLRRRDHALILLLSLTTPLLMVTGLPATNLPAVALLISSFYGSALGLTVIGLLGVALPVGMQITWSQLLASLMGSAVGAVMAGRLRSREELALLGGVVGLTQGVIYLIMSLIVSTATSPVWLTLLTAALVQSLMGVAWSVVALGVSPYLEHLFDLVTPIRLVELSNPNRPLLKRLASEAPGTFQHTLFVASLAEAAARELNCNVELVRAGTLYHDIGKMHDPEGFIENQMSGTNKHDEIDNPWTSAQIIKKHVSEGLVMARKCRLPGAIQSFIPEHQGTMLITYFYYQAQQQAKEDSSIIIREEDFRYIGPIPQSRETGIVMLADSCEAALRSLKDATPEEALAMVNRILRARWQDNQLVDSGLNRQDMARIAEIFVRVWQQYNHKRIPYPKAAFAPRPPSPVR